MKVTPMTGSGQQNLPVEELDRLLSDLDELKAEFSSEPWTVSDGERPSVVKPNPIDPARRQAENAARDVYKADAFENGDTATAWKLVNEHRKTPEGQEQHNKIRRGIYYDEKVELTGKPPRAYNKAPSADDRKGQKRVSKQAKIDAMTPDELKEYRDKMARKERERRAQAKADAIALAARAIV